MKSSSNALVFLIALALPASSQDQAGAVSGKLEILKPEQATAQIIGPVPDGTPPPPAPPKPEFEISAREILRSTVHSQGGREITVSRIKPIVLPPPPAPEEPAALSEDFRQRLAEYREVHPRSGLLFLSATVYRQKDGPPRTFVRYWPDRVRQEIQFWSSADFALIAGGVKSFADTEGRKHHIFMGWGNVDIGRMSDLLAARGRTYQIPKIPSFPAGKASFQIIGNVPPDEQLVAIRSLHDIYNREYNRLAEAYKGREQARIAHEAYLKAHPPQPRNISLHYWRSKRPAPSQKGGDR